LESVGHGGDAPSPGSILAKAGIFEQGFQLLDQFEAIQQISFAALISAEAGEKSNGLASP
jgi:hypothetical protein